VLLADYLAVTRRRNLAAGVAIIAVFAVSFPVMSLTNSVVPLGIGGVFFLAILVVRAVAGPKPPKIDYRQYV